jgi:hypothetical protein
MVNLTHWIIAVTSLAKKTVWLVVALVIGLVAGLVHDYHNTFKKVYVQLNPNLQLSIYKDLGGDDAYAYNTQKPPLLSLDSSQTTKLKKSVYDFVVNDPTHQYENPIIKVVIDNNTNFVGIAPSYTTGKLAELLNSQRATIQRALLSWYPALPSFYTISTEHLYEQGDWYGAVLKPLNPANDQLKVILQNSGGRWKVAAKPQISIGIPSNQSIPPEVIDNLDQL